jgi:hypothetical protein
VALLFEVVMIPDGTFTVMFVAIALFGAAIAATLIFGLPWLWSLIKPLLHVVSA